MDGAGRMAILPYKQLCERLSAPPAMSCWAESVYQLFFAERWGLDAKVGLSSYLVWVGVKFSNAKEEELLVNDTSQIGSKKFDFSIE